MAGHHPTKTLTKGLEFKQHEYAQPLDKARAEFEEAYHIIEEKLPVLSQLGHLVEVELKGKPPILIDGRNYGQSALLLTDLSKNSEKTAAQLVIQPKHVILFARGGLEPRFALNVNIVSHDGDVAVAVKFLDLLTPDPPSPVKNYTVEDTSKLPQPTEDLDQVKRDIEEFGYDMVKNALSPDEVAILRKAVDDQAAGELRDGTAQSWEGNPDVTQQLWVLSNKGDEFLDLLNHPLIDEVVPWLLREDAHLHGYLASIARPGNKPLAVHTDQLAIQPPMRHIPLGLNMLWFLTDFKRENGGTRLYPGSHKSNVAPANYDDYSDSVAAEGPAGTALVYDARLWHTTGPDRQVPSSNGDNQ
ncbi:PhyH-domain-containing protein [Xylariaceae sp. FL0594]|nr:PhyH-domain-containing protein [Xylariaceae sp. FL0594]